MGWSRSDRIAEECWMGSQVYSNRSLPGYADGRGGPSYSASPKQEKPKRRPGKKKTKK